jgi:hypothetical protein
VVDTSNIERFVCNCDGLLDHEKPCGSCLGNQQLDALIARIKELETCSIFAYLRERWRLKFKLK